MTPGTQQQTALDPVTFEVIRHRLWAINDEQAMIAARMSGSPVIYEVYDFNAGILTADGHGLVAGIYILHHAATIDFFVQKILRDWPLEDISEGDMFFTNDPWCGALHSNDGVLVTPIFWEGEIVCWSGLAMHDEDVGSPVPGSFVVGARDRYGEAPLYPTVKMVEGFELRRDIEAVFLRNSRTPDHNALNLRGRMASLTVTHRRIHELISDYGIETFRAATEETLDYVEEVVRGRLREMPDGAWFHRIHLDHNGNENELYPICCRISKQCDRLVIDFTGTAEQAPGAVNCARAALEGAVIGVFLMFLCYDLPWSVGAAHRIVEIVSEEGTINNALPPAATSMASISGTLATQAAVANAFAKMLLASGRFREEAQADWSSIPNCLVLAGLDRRGEPFATVDMNNCGGGAGARTFADGIDTGGIFHSMGSTIPNVETMESRTPELAVFRRQRADSAGNGRFRGGAGLELLLAPHKNPAPVDHITISAFASQPDNAGLAGGSPAAVNSNVLLRGTDLPELFADGHVPREAGEIAGEREVVEAKARSEVAGGDAHLYLQTGGGGYGDPLRRDPEAVLVDLRHGLVTAETATEVYGVVVAGEVDAEALAGVAGATGAEGSIDAEATASRREDIRRARIAESKPVREGAPTPPKAEGGDAMHPVADTVEAARVDGSELIRCTVCATRLGAYTEDYKAGTLWRERPFTALSPLNAVAPATPLRAREYCCPGCGTLVAVDIAASGEPPLAECAFGDGSGVPVGGFMKLSNDEVEEER